MSCDAVWDFVFFIPAVGTKKKKKRSRNEKRM